MKKSNLKILASIIIFFIIGLIFYFTVIDKVGTFSTTNYYLDTSTLGSPRLTRSFLHLTR